MKICQNYSASQVSNFAFGRSIGRSPLELTSEVLLDQRQESLNQGLLFLSGVVSDVVLSLESVAHSLGSVEEVLVSLSLGGGVSDDGRLLGDGGLRVVGESLGGGLLGSELSESVVEDGNEGLVLSNISVLSLVDVLEFLVEVVEESVEELVDSGDISGVDSVSGEGGEGSNDGGVEVESVGLNSGNDHLGGDLSELDKDTDVTLEGSVELEGTLDDSDGLLDGAQGLSVELVLVVSGSGLILELSGLLVLESDVELEDSLGSGEGSLSLVLDLGGNIEGGLGIRDLRGSESDLVVALSSLEDVDVVSSELLVVDVGEETLEDLVELLGGSTGLEERLHLLEEGELLAVVARNSLGVAGNLSVGLLLDQRVEGVDDGRGSADGVSRDHEGEEDDSDVSSHLSV